MDAKPQVALHCPAHRMKELKVPFFALFGRIQEHFITCEYEPREGPNWLAQLNPGVLDT
jgi:hypothetical protein